MSRFWEKFFFIYSLIFQGSSYLSPYAYGILHRMHHAYPDTEKDVHSPKYDKNIWNMMWKTKNIYNAIYYRKIEIEPKFLKNLPKWEIIDKIGDSWAMRIFWGLFYTLCYYLLGAEWWMYFTLLPIQYLLGPTQGMIINWFAHKYGYVNYDVKDTSKNLLPVDLLMLGEAYHNNHHKYGSRPNFGVKWHEFDPVYPVIRFLDAIKVIRLNKTPIPA